ncbi:oligosaccharide flippase family protein [Nocardioides sp. LHD-245]|uniref:oligosaccharide flippase family protein n=1 Tax=Nocardioides sp. LHD-245 TaxID=3051387 RepID=UPI0027E0CCD6|nr:oligosaccharide flippase family protein [Nocardioides sp. LHD-245]
MTQVAEQADTLRRTGATVLALGASELLGKVATFLTVLVMARLLGVADFGLLSFGLSLGLLLSVLPGLGLDARVIQLGSARPELLDRCYGALVAIRVVVSGVVLTLTGVVLFATMTPHQAVVVALLVASCLLDTVTDASRAACAARRRQQLSALVLVLQRFSVLVLCAGMLLATRSAVDGAVGYLLGTAIGVLGMQVAAHRAGARPRVRGSGAEARLVLRAAPVTGLGDIAAMGVFRIDAALIGVLLGTTAVGIYGAGYRVFESILFVSWTLSRAFVPLIASRPDDRRHVGEWAERGLVLACAVYLPYGVVIALRGDDLVALLFGEQYVHPGVLLGLAAAPLLFGVTHVCASVLLALRPDPVVLVAGVLALAVNVAMNLLLVPRWGITAAAVATTTAFLVESVVLGIALSRITGRFCRLRPLAALVPGALVAGIVVELVDPVALAVPAGAVAFLAVWAAAARVVDPVLFGNVMAFLRNRPRGAGRMGV